MLGVILALVVGTIRLIGSSAHDVSQAFQVPFNSHGALRNTAHASANERTNPHAKVASIT